LLQPSVAKQSSASKRETEKETARDRERDSERQRVASIVAAMGRAEEMPNRAVKAGDGLRHYYMSHIHDSLLQLRVKTHNLHRLEAQRNDLNSKGPSFYISVSSWPFSFIKNLSFFFSLLWNSATIGDQDVYLLMQKVVTLGKALIQAVGKGKKTKITSSARPSQE
jgi:hypothetical protein